MDPSPEKVAAMVAKYPSLKKVVESGIAVSLHVCYVKLEHGLTSSCSLH
jgi:catechol O-methyltransferase